MLQAVRQNEAMEGASDENTLQLWLEVHLSTERWADQARGMSKTLKNQTVIGNTWPNKV